MRGRLLALTIIALATAGCATQCQTERPIPGMDNSRHAEQINSSSPRSWN
jgi:uncharacterized protein YceK